jgi:hypothetical protein
MPSHAFYGLGSWGVAKKFLDHQGILKYLRKFERDG